jgi:signal transduction histidine kinase
MPGPFTAAVIRAELTRACILLAAALIISLMSRMRRISEARLAVALTELQERTDALVESLNSSKCASWVMEFDRGARTRWYSGSYPVYGKPFSELEALSTLRLLLHPEDQPRLDQLIQTMETSNDPILFEHRILWPAGEVHWLEMRGTRIHGARPRWRGVTLDITERRLSEAALLRAEKLAAMGRLASTVAHEINNPLEAVTNLLFLARTDETVDATTRTYLSMADRELARLGNITRLTLGFVRSNAEPAQIEMIESIDDVVSILRHRFESRSIEIVRDFEPGVLISIPPHEMRQIVTNLIANATDAVYGPGAKIGLRVARVNNCAELIVEDNGDGIPEANLQRIFDPFFSTKAEVGTGIGLWVTREIVEKNGGHISVESGELSNGFRTRFRVEFPLVVAA